MERTQITVDLPVHLREWFLGIMSCCVEQTFMEAYHDCDEAQGDYLDVGYPGWNDKIVLTEVKDDYIA